MGHERLLAQLRAEAEKEAIAANAPRRSGPDREAELELALQQLQLETRAHRAGDGDFAKAR